MYSRLVHTTHHANFSYPYLNCKEGLSVHTACFLFNAVSSVWPVAARDDPITILSYIIPNRHDLYFM